MKKYINRPYVYLISDGIFYKIGCSMNPFRRLKQLKTANPKCKLLGYSKKYTEKHLHEKYKKWKVSGEWFNLPQYEVERLILEMRKPKPIKTVTEIKELNLHQYIIPYGEYKGRELCSMNTVDEIKYLRNQLKELPKYCEEWAMFTRWCHELSINKNINNENN